MSGCGQDISASVLRIVFRDGNKRSFYSFVHLDKKSRDAGIQQLKKYALKKQSRILHATIYDNISGEIIDRIIINGQIK